MPYDPNFPPHGAELISEDFRSQFHGIKDLIDGVPAGPPGPQGDPGPMGPPGNNGNDGATGPAGPSVAASIVDGVNTLNPGDPATVTTSFDGTSAHFLFGIPRGAAGADGAGGPTGPQGNDGAQGPPGEVTNAALTAAIAGTSANTNAVATMDVSFINDPPTLADLEMVRAKINELITALRRV